MSDARLKELGELVLNRRRDEVSEEVKVGMLVTQLAKERRKSREAKEALAEVENANRELLTRSTELESKLLFHKDEAVSNAPVMNATQRSLIRRYLEIQRSANAPVSKPPKLELPVKSDDDQVVFESIEWSARLNQAPRTSLVDDVTNLLDLIRFQEGRN